MPYCRRRSFAQPKAVLNETTLLEPVTRFELGLWRLKQEIERNGREYAASVYMSGDRLNISITVSLDGPLSEPADKVCAERLGLVQSSLVHLEKLFESPWGREPLRPPSLKLDNDSVAQRLALQQQTDAYISKLRDEADVEAVFRRNGGFDPVSQRFISYDESYGCKVLGGQPKRDVIFKRLK